MGHIIWLRGIISYHSYGDSFDRPVITKLIISDLLSTFFSTFRIFEQYFIGHFWSEIPISLKNGIADFPFTELNDKIGNFPYAFGNANCHWKPARKCLVQQSRHGWEFFCQNVPQYYFCQLNQFQTELVDLLMRTGRVFHWIPLTKSLEIPIISLYSIAYSL